ncbi:MAG: phosphoribosylformylglycinamidine synthase [Flavobacteriales bacterium]|jgi:phosphoribosylformylglycinamidine synthase|nr:phosphoribosylformylglycinamidine synthase [Flavobacteriales bacterium]
MLSFFKGKSQEIYALQSAQSLTKETIEKLVWLLGNAEFLNQKSLTGSYLGPRKEMISPWSTNAVEITQNMGISGIERMEIYLPFTEGMDFDPMLQVKFSELNQELFDIDIAVEKILEIEDLAAYNEQEGLALSEEEITYLESVSQKIGRKLTDSEVFGYSQINSEHCRHKIFNGTFIIDGKEQESTLFSMIRKTSKETPDNLVSAYKDNVAFVEGMEVTQFAPKTGDKADFYQKTDYDSVLSLKAETHNFPTTVEPFNGAATGSGGEIRDRMAGGKGSIPLAGTAVYMTSYPRLENGRDLSGGMDARPWLYQTPLDILVKASNGASDFGNKFGQPLIAGSVLTFEHEEGKKFGFDKVIMLAGGIGIAKKKDALKETPEKGDKIVVMGGDNYRIGMGGSAVSSVDTGEFAGQIELNAIQRSNPEMQKRVANAIRTMSECAENPIVSIHDHGAGGHLNCLSELVEETGGKIDLAKLPVGDKTLSAKEIIGNESQERMGLILKAEDVEQMRKISERERAPFYVVGEITDDHRFSVVSSENGEAPIELGLEDFFGNSPKTILEDQEEKANFKELDYQLENLEAHISNVLQLEAVACKDWLTNKVDRCVSGRVAQQQNVGELHIPLSNVGVMTQDYEGKAGIATSIGHAPISALIDPVAGSRNSIAEALTNIVWAPIKDGLKGVSLSANWMWPAKNEGENARLYNAVEGVSDFACQLGINIPTGKDSLSMTQKYADEKVYSPGTVIISGIGNCTDIKKVVTPNLKPSQNDHLIYIDFSKDTFKLGGSSFAQTLNTIGKGTPTIQDASYFKNAFNFIQDLVDDQIILAGHDISAGGMITALLEMCFPQNGRGLNIDLSTIKEEDLMKILFAENAGILLQIEDLYTFEEKAKQAGIDFINLGNSNEEAKINVNFQGNLYNFDVNKYRDIWFKTSYLLDRKQSGEEKAKERFENYKNHELKFNLPTGFDGKLPELAGKKKIKAAIIREKGSNSEREMAHAMHLAGFEVKDIHTTDLMSGREDLSDVHFIAAVGGFSNSDVLGSAKGWAGVFKYNENAKKALENFVKREDTLSLGVCNGCQLFMELDLVYPEMENHPKMHHNDSHKFESGFVSVDIPENNSVMLSSLEGTSMGIWVAHGEGKFVFDNKEEINIVSNYTYSTYPANPNGSEENAMAVASKDGRILAMMPHLERSIFPWNWAHYPNATDEVSPWIRAFENAHDWIAKK